MKKIYLISLLFISMALSSCCDCMEPAAPAEGYEYLVSITDDRTFTADQFRDLIVDYVNGYAKKNVITTNTDTDSENSVIQKIVKKAVTDVAGLNIPVLDRKYNRHSPFEKGRQWEIRRCRFQYLSTSYKGEPIVLSGVVTFPTLISGEPSEVDSYSLYCHPAFSLQSEAPTISDDAIFARTFFNSAVIEADFEGYGCTSDRFFAANMYDKRAKQEVDCAMAAIEIMKQHGVTLAADGRSDSWGYSLGGPPAMAVQKYLENEAPNNVTNALRFRSTFCGGGPFELYELIKFYDNNPDYSRFSLVYCVDGINSLSEEELDGYNPMDIWNKDTMNTLLSDGTPVFDQLFIKKDLYIITSEGCWPKYGSDIGLFSPDMLKPDGNLDYNSKKAQVVLNMARTHGSMRGWQPKHPLYISHDPYDLSIPSYQTELVAEDLMVNDDGSINHNVHFWHNMLDKVPELEGMRLSVHMVDTWLNISKMILFETPEDVYRKAIRI